MSVLLNACSVTRNLPEGEKLYTGAHLKLISKEPLDDENKLRNTIEEVLQPAPNARLLWFRPGPSIYQLFEAPKKQKGLIHWLKYKVGKPPVLLSSVKPESVSRLIENRLNNHGYFNAEVDFEIRDKGEKKASLIYHAHTGTPYKIDSVIFETDTGRLGKVMQQLGFEHLLKSGENYKLDDLRAERERIDDKLKNQGFFYFQSDYIKVTADTSVGNHRMNIYIGKQPNLPLESTTVYSLKKVVVFPDYQLNDQTDLDYYASELFKGIDFRTQSERMQFRPKALERSVFLYPNETYSRESHSKTLNRLMGLDAFKYADVRFEKSQENNNQLDARIYLTPMDKKTVRAELEMVSKSNNFTGPGLDINWTNRNTFNGAELLRISGKAGFETIIGGSGDENGVNSADFLSYQLGINAELFVPRFISPFNIKHHSDFVPKTRINVSAEFINRTRFFALTSLSSGLAYVWRNSKTIHHEFTPVALVYTSLTKTTAAFQEILDKNPFLQNSFSEQFILGPEYRFVFNNQVIDELKNHVYFAAGLDLSNPGGVFGSTFATYFRLTTDLRYYLKISKKSKLVSRFYSGVGLPYRDSEQLPYLKQFFSGGPNGIRAFRARTVGPGSFRAAETAVSSGFLDQNGDIKLELNLEYRFQIISIFEGAIFADAGNIWLVNDNPSQPGGVFDTAAFFSQIAAGIGAGIRTDLSFFMLRLDLAFPVRKPYLEENDGWVSNPLREKPTLNLAIGYPF
jgi:outer membrane protein assembly factor BamA